MIRPHGVRGMHTFSSSVEPSAPATLSPRCLQVAATTLVPPSPARLLARTVPARSAVSHTHAASRLLVAAGSRRLVSQHLRGAMLPAAAARGGPVSTEVVDEEKQLLVGCCAVTSRARLPARAKSALSAAAVLRHAPQLAYSSPQTKFQCWVFAPLRANITSHWLPARIVETALLHSAAAAAAAAGVAGPTLTGS